MTMSALAALALVTATDVRADETVGNTVWLPDSKDTKVTLVYQHALPGIPGKSVKGVLVEYGPGGYSPSHTHAKSALIFATVIEGEVRSKVNDGPEKTYRTGENWTELPGGHHRVSANASETRSLSLTIRTRCFDTRQK